MVISRDMECIRKIHVRFSHPLTIKIKNRVKWSIIRRRPVDLWILRHSEGDAIALQSVLGEATGENSVG